MTVAAILALLPAPRQQKLCSNAMTWSPGSRTSQTQERHRDVAPLLLFTGCHQHQLCMFQGSEAVLAQQVNPASRGV